MTETSLSPARRRASRAPIVATRRRLRTLAAGISVLILLGLSGCDDGPLSPSGRFDGPRASLALAPRFDIADGAEDAVARAFDRVNRFSLVLLRIPSGEVAVDTVIDVTPGADEYAFEIPVTLRESSERFTLELRALEVRQDGSEVQLFASSGEVEATAGQTSASAEPVTMEYAGPDAGAAEVTVTPPGLVLSPGGTATLAAAVLDDAGEEISGATVAWESEDAGVAEVDAGGGVTAAGLGSARVTVTTAGGLSASAWVHVAIGELAFAGDAGDIYRATVDGSSVTRVAAPGDARLPARRPDGSGLVFESGSSVVEIPGGAVVLEGAGAPAFTADGTKLTGVAGGTLVHANADGTLPTEGAAGEMPAWLGDGAHLVVEGGSLQRVRADGATREQLIADASARWPAVAPGGGRLAYVTGAGGLRVVNADGSGARRVTPTDFEVTARPAWSPDGSWFLVAGSGADGGPGLHLVPVSATVADGPPPVPLSIDVEGARDPAWRPTGGPASPPALELTALEPERSLPGDTVRLEGSGFDWIIPGNNAVELPGAAGEPVAAEVLSAATDHLRFVTPEGIAREGGELTARTFTSEAILAYTPESGAIRLVAETSYGKRVDGVEAEVVDGSGAVLASATTGGDGTVEVDDLLVGDYEVRPVSAPSGFGLESGPVTLSVTLDGTTDAVVRVGAEPAGISVSPGSLALDEPGAEGTLTATVVDADGDEIPTARPTWSSSEPRAAEVRGAGLEATVVGRGPGETTVTAAAGSASDGAGVAVRGAVRGSVEYRFGIPFPGAEVTIAGAGASSGASSGAADGGSSTASPAASAEDGSFDFIGLLPGSYEVTLEVPEGGYAVQGSATRTVTLSLDSPEPSVEFLLDPPVAEIGFAAEELVVQKGETGTATAVLLDPRGVEIPDVEPGWTSSDDRILEVAASSGLDAEVDGVAPGDGRLTAAVDDVAGELPVAVHGTVDVRTEYRWGDPFPDVGLTLLRGATDVGSATADEAGRASFDDVPAGSYDLRIAIPEHYTVQGSGTEEVELSVDSPEPEITFPVIPEPRSIGVDPQTLALDEGETVSIAAPVHDARDVLIPDATLDWTSSAPEVATVDGTGPDAAVTGVDAGETELTAVAGSISATAAVTVRGVVRGTVVYEWGDPFDGAEVTLTQDGAAIRDVQTTGTDGAFRFAGVDAGDYSLAVDPVFSGYVVRGGTPIPVTVGPGNEPLEVALETSVRRLKFEPPLEDLGLVPGSSKPVTARAYDPRDNLIPSFDVVEWTSLSPDLLEIRPDGLSARFRGLADGTATFELQLGAQVFEESVLVGTPDPLVVSPEEAEKLPDGTQQFTVLSGPEGPYEWLVNGVVGGSAPFGTIDSDGFYTAPSEVPDPATFPVCVRLAANPSNEACAEVTIEPVPTAGEDVVVFNDVNPFDDNGMSNRSNRTMVRNLVNFTSDGDRSSGTRIWLDRGRNSRCAGPCVSVGTFIQTIEGEGFTFEFISSSQGSLTSIPSDVKVIFLWNPTIEFTVAEINTLKAFASEGGRIVYVGEWDGFYGSAGLATENAFLSDMGAQMTNIGQAVDCGFHTLPGSRLRQHQVTGGMTDVRIACASVIEPGPNDFTLFLDSSGTKVLAGVAKIDVTPLPTDAPPAHAADAPTFEPVPPTAAERRPERRPDEADRPRAGDATTGPPPGADGGLDPTSTTGH